MASYPGTVFSKSDIANGATSDATDVNDLSHEISAIEDGLLNGTARLNSSATSVQTLQVVGNSTFGGVVTANAQPRCHVMNSAVTSASSNSTGRFTWDQELYDVGAMHSTALNPSRVTVGSSGLYHCQAQVFFATVSTAADLYLLKNSSRETGTRCVTGALGGQTFFVHGALQCEAGDVLELEYVSGLSTASFGAAGAIAAALNRFMVTKVW